MPRDEDKIISLEQAREREADRRRAEAQAKQKAAREAQRRRRLAEHGPGATRAGRMIGRWLAVFILLVGLASLGAWIWSLAT